MATVVIQHGKVKPLLFRHPWVYASSVERVEGEAADGDVVDVRAPDRRFLGRGFYSGKSALRVRMFDWTEGAVADAAWVRARVAAAARYRKEVLRLPDDATTAFRAIHGDADGLPGVVADRLGDVLSLQITSVAMERRKTDLLDALEAEWAPKAIIELPDESTREKEGLPPGGGVLRGTRPEGGKVLVRENGITFEADLAVGQKTGFYCDQRENRARAASFARGRRVLDAFSYTGGFAIACAKAGAASVEAIESGGAALEMLRANALRNDADVTVHTGDVYKHLGKARHEKRSWDLVILDPPKYARTRNDLLPALQKYAELIALGASVTAPGGILVACTCSGLVDVGTFDDVVREAARQNARDLRLIERRGQAPCHPVSAFGPEGRYLQAVFLHAP